MSGCSFQELLRQNLRGILSYDRKTLFLTGFILKQTERAYALLKNGILDFRNIPPLERLACFYITINGNFERCQYFNFETNFLKSENLFQKTGGAFLVENTRIENASFSYNFCFNFRTSYKDLI